MPDQKTRLAAVRSEKTGEYSLQEIAEICQSVGAATLDVEVQAIGDAVEMVRANTFGAPPLAISAVPILSVPDVGAPIANVPIPPESHLGCGNASRMSNGCGRASMRTLLLRANPGPGTSSRHIRPPQSLIG